MHSLDSADRAQQGVLMRLLAPGKVNLHLRIGPRREHGFHPLLSWMCTISLFDRLELNCAGKPGQKPLAELALECSDPTLATDQGNLVVQAATALADAARSPREGVLCDASAFLDKQIPSGAGLGGGSSDAAAALIGLNRLWKLNWPLERLTEIAAQLGSDVPFFLHGPSSVCQGHGEIVSPIAPPAPRCAMLVLPGFSLSTADVYRRFDEMGLGNEDALTQQPDWKAWTKLPAGELMPRLINDLEPPAFSLEPRLVQFRSEIERLSGQPVRMSGSGSSLFSLFDEQEQAESAAKLVVSTLGLRALAVALAPLIDGNVHESSND